MKTSVKASLSAKNQSSFLSPRLEVFLLLAFCLILFFYKLGSYPLFDLDEPRYAEAGREMLESGNWITPYFNYALRFDKPVFFYWLVALAYKLFGVNEFGARFFSAVTATGTVMAVYAFGRHFISRQTGLFSALMLATCGLFIGIARMSITDMTLSFFMTVTTLCLYLAAHKSLKWWLAAGVFAGLGVLTKGPVALVVPGAVLTFYAIVIGDFKRCLLNRWLPLALAICAAIAIPWYVLAYLQNGQIFIDALLLHNVTRYSDVVSGHKQPVYFYVIVLLAGFMPWTLYLPAAVRHLWEGFKQGHRQQIEAQNHAYLVPLYAFVWTVFIFIFFTISNTKLLTYILPLFPALGLLAGAAWHAQSQRNQTGDRTGQRWFSIPGWILPISTLIGGLVFITNMETLLPREAAGIESNQYNVVVVLLMLAGTTLTAILISRARMAAALQSLCLTMGVILIIAMHGIVPNISNAAQGVMMEYLQQTGGKPVMLYEIQRPSLTFYGRRRVPRFVEEERPELLQELHKNKETFVITKTSHLAEFSQLLPTSLQLRILEKGPVYSLLAVQQAPCAPKQECPL